MEDKIQRRDKKGTLEEVLKFALIGVFAFLIIGGAIFYQNANGSSQLQNNTLFNSTYNNIDSSYGSFNSSISAAYSNYTNSPGAQSPSILGGTSLTFNTIPAFFTFLTSGILGIYHSTFGLIYSTLHIPPIVQWTIGIFLGAAIVFGIWKALRIGLPD